ncbi:unnamed protein product [Amoebophrya sp. A25]|nr:unnamed protein product [Amoebophrya sp. A25]|eukprot:GSA25T00018702001.1
MRFPCFRSEEWMNKIFEKDVEVPSGVLKDVDLTPAYLQNYPTAALFPTKVAGVREQIRRTLFRQVLFKVQNVEVTYMKDCKADRVLSQVISDRIASGEGPSSRMTEGSSSSEDAKNYSRLLSSSSTSGASSSSIGATAGGRSVFSSSSTHTSEQSGSHSVAPRNIQPEDEASTWESSSATSSGGGGARLELAGYANPREGDRNSHDQSSSQITAYFSDLKQRGLDWFFDTVHLRGGGSSEVEFLREEFWTVDRCGQERDYRVRYYREAGGDGFTTAVWPKKMRDKVALLYYHCWQ